MDISEYISKEGMLLKGGERFSVTTRFDMKTFTMKGIVKKSFIFYGVNNDNMVVVWIIEPLSTMPSVLTVGEMVGIGLFQPDKEEAAKTKVIF